MRRAVAAVGLSLCLGSAPVQALAANNELRIGVLTDLGSIYADFAGQGLVSAVEMAVEDAGGRAAGRTVRLYIDDTGLQVERAIELAEGLRRDHGVNMITGIVGSDEGLALQAWGREHRVITLNTVSATAELTGASCSPYGVHWTYDTWAVSAGTANAIVQEGGKSWFLIVADYAFGHAMAQQASEAVIKAGGEIVGQTLVPYRGQDFSAALELARASGADIVAIANAGGDMQLTVRQAYELGLVADGQSLMSFLVFLGDIRRLGLYATAGLTFTTGFVWNRNDDTIAWSERFRRRTGEVPTMAQAGAYSAVRHYLRAVEATGSVDPDVVMAAMREMPVDDFFAEGGRLRADGRMVHDMYLVRVKRPSQSRGRSDYHEVQRVIPAAEAFRPLELGGCPLVSAQRN